jgi:hypothetical protein
MRGKPRRAARDVSRMSRRRADRGKADELDEFIEEAPSMTPREIERSLNLHVR